MEKLFTTLLSLTVGGGMVALLVLGLKALFGKKLPSAFFYYAWLVVLLRFLLPIPGVVHYEQTVPEAAPAAVSRNWRNWHPMRDRQMQTGNLAANAPTQMDYQENVPAAEPRQLPQSFSQGIDPSAEDEKQPEAAPAWVKINVSPAQWITLIWMGGASASMALFLMSYRRFIRALKKTLRQPNLREVEAYRSLDGPRRLKLLRSGGVSTPMQLGLLCPRLILPEREYPNGMLENILRHELTHYTRHDILYKWFALFVCCLHWFNPLAWVIRRELDRACELSCDERLLKSMTVQEKRSYGETLLAMASDRALPRRVIATSFATEKRNLKERLEQIMTYQHKGKTAILLTMCAVLLLCCFALATGPAQAEQMPEGDVPTQSVNAPEAAQMPSNLEPVTVSNVDEFLAAIAPGRSITLMEGTYNLSKASAYPKEDSRKVLEEGRTVAGSDFYYWTPDYDGYSLVICDLSGLTIEGVSGAGAEIVTEPRCADVVRFDSCQNISLNNLTVGHTIAADYCMGGVLRFTHTDNVVVDGCALYGCGTWGVIADECRQMQILESKIYDCSVGAIQLGGCHDVRVDGCEIFECNGIASGLLELWQCEQVAFINSHIHDNKEAPMLVITRDSSKDVYMGGLLVENNDFVYALYSAEDNPIIFSNSDISQSNRIPGGFKGSHPNLLPAVSPEGKVLEDDDINFHHQSEVNWEEIVWSGKQEEALEIKENTAKDVVYASTVDEFLAAIAPGANIILKDGDYNLTRASNYPQKTWEELAEGRSVQGSDYYYWIPCYDGYSLSITGVNDLTIQAEDGANVQIMTAPRYADVLHFERCQGISLSNLTVGHTIEKGSCTGGVLDFESTDNVVVDGCSLYGCGTWGVYARDCQQMQVIGSKIYDCSEGAVQLGMCRDVQVDRCEIYECEGYGGLLEVWQSEQVAFTNSHIYNNKGIPFLVQAYDRSQGVYMGGLLVENNDFESGLYCSTQAPIIFSHCEINELNLESTGFMGADWSELVHFTAVSPEGKVLSDDDVNFHSRKQVTWTAEMEQPAPEAMQPDADGMIHVSTVDEFLAAIGPDRTVYLEPGDYNLTTASNYGRRGGYYYSWREEVDGYSLTLNNITGLTIDGAGADKVNVVTVPRYADVFLLQGCEDLALRNINVGHTVEEGACCGDVLEMEFCSRIQVSGCSLFGCGVYGVNAYSCDGLQVENTEIHHCSQGVAWLSGCTDVAFSNCDIHDNFYEYENNGKIGRFDANEICTDNRYYPVESGKDYTF